MGLATTTTTKAKKRPPNRLNGAFTKRETGYRFTDKDAELEYVVHCIDEYTGGTAKEYRKLALKAGISYSTLRYSWPNKTRRPMNLSLKWVMEAMGYTQGGKKDNFGWRRN